MATERAIRSLTGPRAAWVYVSGEPDTPGHLYRVERHAEAARALGVRTRIVRVEDCRSERRAFASAQVVVIWRAAWSDQIAVVITEARSAGALVVFDIDDLIFDPGLADTSLVDGVRSSEPGETVAPESYAAFRQVLAAADLCTTTTDELAQQAIGSGTPSLVLPNGFDEATYSKSQSAARRWAASRSDALLRIGYAAGSRTHQRDFGTCAEAVATILRARSNVRLVLFRCSASQRPLLDITEYPEFEGLGHRIEWRDSVTLDQLPEEIARFDINLAPLVVRNPFCEAKSELKYFEAALAGVCTIASPTGPFSRVIRHGETGYLAESQHQWLSALQALLDDETLRRQMAVDALRDVLWQFGPDLRAQRIASLRTLPGTGRAAAAAFACSLRIDSRSRSAIIPDHRIVCDFDRFGVAQATVVIPLYNYAHFIAEALDSVYAQSLEQLDLVVIDDASRDDGLAVVRAWATAHAKRFNRVLFLQNLSNAGLGPSRNLGFDQAQTQYVLPLDADNRLLPRCIERCLDAIRKELAAFAYPTIRKFGGADDLIGDRPYRPLALATGNYIDAMALISKSAWAAVGGYDDLRLGWEDYDLWCKFAERGLFGVRVGEDPLAEYRVHPSSMLHTTTEVNANKQRLAAQLSARHPWAAPSPKPIAQMDDRPN
jgi:glycosyltransferase involved in cell wall biosynthesis